MALITLKSLVQSPYWPLHIAFTIVGCCRHSIKQQFSPHPWILKWDSQYLLADMILTQDMFSELRFSSSLADICVAPESQGGFEREQIREQIGGFIGHFSMGRLRRFLSGIVYGNPFRAGILSASATSWKCLNFCHNFAIFNFYISSRKPDIWGAYPLRHLHGWHGDRLLRESHQHDRCLHGLPEGKLSHTGQPSQTQHPKGSLCTLRHGKPEEGDCLRLCGVLDRRTEIRSPTCSALFWPLAQNAEVKKRSDEKLNFFGARY